MSFYPHFRELRHAKLIGYDLMLKSRKEKRALRNADAIVLSEMHYGRFEHFPKKSRRYVRNLNRLRELYPYVVYFRAPFWLKVGFHNPDIEIRFKKPLDTLQKTG